MRRVGLFLLLVALPVSAQPRSSEFTQVVRDHFFAWDLNKNGVLEGAELDKLMRDPRIRGKSAAALATLKQQSRETRKRSSWLASRETLDFYDDALASGRTPPRKLDGSFRAMQKRLEGASHLLYADGGPHLEAIRQVSGGDCYFLSTVLGMLARNPADVRALIHEERDGSFTVQFPGRAPHRIARPTEAATALYTDNRGDGQWLYVLLMAFGEERLKEKRFADVEDPGDATDAGGNVGAAMEVLTGRRGKVGRVGPFGGPDKQRWVRETLAQALAERRLVALATGKPRADRQMPKGISTGHVMAVIGFDRDKDEVVIRNPWGNTLHPADPGPVQGYPTEDGLFRLSVPDVCRYFSGMIVER